MKEKARVIVGWIAVISITIVAGFWSFWGTIENFHEGWWQPNLLVRVGVMFVQYLR